MGRYALVTEEKEKREFQRRFLPDRFKWVEHEKDRDMISEKIIFDVGTHSIYTSYFLQAGLRVPFDPLLVNFLRRTRLHFSQVAPNTVRIILDLAEVNRRFSIQLDFWDITYCYILNFSKTEGRWNLKGRPSAPALILGLWDSCKYMYSDTVILKGDVEPNPTEFPVPKQHRLFNKPEWNTIHFEQLNVIARHTGNSDGIILNHPRAVHNLLGYQINYTSFQNRTSSGEWIREKLDPPARYQLLARYNILNSDIRLDSERRARQAVAGLTETVQGHQKKQKKNNASKSARVNPLAVSVAGESSFVSIDSEASVLAALQVTATGDAPTTAPLPKATDGTNCKWLKI